MVAELLKTGLDILDQQGISSPVFQNYFSSTKYILLDDDIAAATLVVLVGQSAEGDDAATLLFSLLLDEARMGVENDSVYGQAFLGNVEKTITAGLEAGHLEPHHLLKFAAHYTRNGLAVPDALIINPDMVPRSSEDPSSSLEENIEALADEIQAEGGGAYDLFCAIQEMSAAMPEEIQAGLVNHLATLNNPVFERCALYWLMSGTPLIQEATAAGLSEKLNLTALQPDTLFYMPIIRGWLPAGTSRDIIDAVHKQGRKKGHSAALADQNTTTIQSVMASLTDGVGAQNIVMTGTRNKKTFVAMILTKTGYGIKDAFVVPCRSKREAQSILVQSGQEANGAKISQLTTELFLEAALADGIENGRMPEPGFIDVMEIFDLHALRPQKRSLQDLLEFVDPKREIQDATPIKFQRMLNDEIALDALDSITDCWFEDTAETRKIIQSARSVQKMETEIWDYLEGRRDIWARRFLQTAIMLKDAKMKRELGVLTASACALMNNRPLREAPLMEDIVYLTLEYGRAILL